MKCQKKDNSFKVWKSENLETNYVHAFISSY